MQFSDWVESCLKWSADKAPRKTAETAISARAYASTVHQLLNANLCQVMAPSRPPRPPSRPARDPKELLKKRGADLIRKVSDKDRYAIFLEPVDVDHVEGYADLISRPMDLSTAQKNLQMGVYRTPMELRADLDLVWSNCCKFNADDSIYFKEAVRLRALAARYYDDLVRLLAKDGVAAALGLSSYRPSGPSTARISQKRPPRHRATSQNSDFPIRMTSPSLQTSERNSVDLDAESQSASASASAGILTSFRDAHLRRARTSYDAAVAAASNAAGETRQATDTAGLHTIAPSSDKQIFDGPCGILGKKRESESVDVNPQKYRIMSKRELRDSCSEIPIAWRRIGRWHIRGATASRVLTRNRAADVVYGRQYQKYVEASAPMARRLLASILDPDSVRESDLNQFDVNKSSPNSSCMKQDENPRKSSSSKPVSEPVGPIAISNGTIPEFANGIIDPMDVVDMNTASAQPRQDEDTKQRKHLRGKLGNMLSSGGKSTMCRDAFKGLFEDAIGSERLSKFSSARVDELAESTQNVIPKNSIYRLRALLKTKGIDATFINNILAHDQESEHGQQKQKDQSSHDSDVQTHRRNLGRLLSANHETMINILRLRALRENANEAALENLEDRERDCVERLADGMSLAVRSLPPQFVVHPLDAAEAATAMARTINSRQPTPSH